MKKLLVTGASGFFGWNVSQQMPQDWQIFGTYKSSPGGIHPKSKGIEIDLTDRDKTWKLLKETSPDALFHLAAISGTGACEKSPNESFPINVEVPTILAEMCGERKIRFLFTSSEQVFDGKKGNYKEAAQPNPQNEYGKQKLEAEKRINNLGTESIIVRMAVMFGAGNPVSNSFLGQWLARWKDGSTVTTFHDEIRSFLSGNAAANGLIHLLNIDASGLFHFGGRNACSRTEFAEMVTSIFNLSSAKINSVSQKEMNFSAYRPSDLSMDCAKMNDTGFHSNGLEEELMKLKKQIDCFEH